MALNRGLRLEKWPSQGLFMPCLLWHLRIMSSGVSQSRTPLLGPTWSDVKFVLLVVKAMHWIKFWRYQMLMSFKNGFDPCFWWNLWHWLINSVVFHIYPLVCHSLYAIRILLLNLHPLMIFNFRCAFLRFPYDINLISIFLFDWNS